MARLTILQEYGADILLPVKLLGHDKQPMAALLTLALCAKLPFEKAKSMAKTVLSLGATCPQADMHGFTAFHRLVEGKVPAPIDLVGELDKVGVKNAINHVVMPYPHLVLWPLKVAIGMETSHRFFSSWMPGQCLTWIWKPG